MKYEINGRLQANAGVRYVRLLVHLTREDMVRERCLI